MKTKFTHILGIVLLVLFSNLGMVCQTRAQNFVHPCIPFSSSDLALLKTHIQNNEYPWKLAYVQLAADGHAQLTYTMQGPFANVSRNPDVNLNQWRNDMTAVFDLSMMWYFTQNQAYAIKARDILLAWANTQTSFTGVEANLDLGDYSYAWGGAASILRGTWSGWTVANTTTLQNFFNNIYWPASGCNITTLGPANKGTLSLSAGAAIAAFSDDPAKVNQIVYLMRYSASAGYPNTLSSGEQGESARDQGHAAGQWGNLALAAEILWKLGIDMYSELDNRMLAEAEYFSRKNSNVAIPYVPFGTTDYYYLTDNTPTWSGGQWQTYMVQGHYKVRKGLSTPYIDLQTKKWGPAVKDTWFYKTADSSTATVPTPLATFPANSLVGTGLTNLDVGTAYPTGSGTFNNNVWTVTGGGAETWTDGADSFHFVYTAVTGDCSIIAKVTSPGNVASNSKSGVMLRSDLSPNASQRAWIGITPGATSESFMHGIGTMFGGSNWAKWARPIPSTTYWVKIERIGDKIATFYSPDGTSWAVENEGASSGWTGTSYIGLFVCSAKNGTLNTATFSNVSVTGGTGGIITTPEAPLFVYASPGNNQVPLRWLSSFGATSYTLKRSTSVSGPYTNLATGLTGTSYADNTVVNGQTYYYKVCAVNSAGTSADSPADSTTPIAPSVPIATTLNGVYKIVAKHSNKVLQVRGNSTTDNAVVEQASYTGATNQLWRVTGLGNNEYTVVNLASGKAMDVLNNSTANSAAIVQNPYSTTDDSQKWDIIDKTNGYFVVLGKQSQKSLDIPGASTAEGVGLALWPFGDGANQNFSFTLVADTIAPVKPFLADITGACSATAIAPTTTDNWPGVIIGTTSDSLTYFTQGIHVIHWSFKDAAGNITTATQNVIIKDTIAPLVITRNIVGKLNSDGYCTITEAQIDNGSTDNCSIATYALDKKVFDCSNIGQNIVTLKITDASGNASTGTAIVTVQDSIAPTAIAQNLTVQLDATGKATITPAQINDGSTDNCSAVTLALDKTTFDCSNVGQNNVTLTVTDATGNSATAAAVVTVQDNTAPVVLTKNITVYLSGGKATITAAQVDNGSNDACGIQSMSLSKTSFDCSSQGDNTVTLTVTDNHNNSATGTAVVTVIGKTPNPAITVSRSDNTYTGLDANTIALGYGAQSLTLTATDANASTGTTFSWSPAAGLSSTTVANPVFTPTQAGTYTFTVIATSQYGCQAGTSVTINVIDARCGTNKVAVCHATSSSSNPYTQLCISASAVPTQLANGGTLGSCAGAVKSTASLAATSPSRLTDTTVAVPQIALKAYPNPFGKQTTIVFTVPANDNNVKLDVYSTQGILVQHLYSGSVQANINNSYEFNGANLAPGIYFVRLITSKGIQTFRLVMVE